MIKTRKWYREQAAKRGLCSTCGSNDPDRKPPAGYKTCHVCRESYVARPAFSVCCQFHGGHRAECSERA